MTLHKLLDMRKYIILAAAVLCISACDMLDRYPQSKMSPETYFRNETDLMLFSNSFYDNLLDKSVFSRRDDQYVNKALTDEVMGGSARDIPASGGGWSWSQLRKINIMLTYIGNCEDEDVRNQYIGVAKFFRAKFYFEKVKRFGDVPWIDRELGSSDEALYAPRDSRELIMTKMIEDIDEAIKYLPEAKSSYRVNKWSALALKAQFCLYEGTFRKYHKDDMDFEGNTADYYLGLAEAAAKEIMTTGPYSLYNTGKPDEDYVRLFAKEDADPNEYILALKYSRTLPLFHDASTYPTMASHGMPGVTKKIIDTYLMKDGSRFTDKPGWETMQFADEVAGRDPRLAQSIRTPGYKMLDARVKTSVDYNTTRTGYQPVKFVMSASVEDAHSTGEKSSNDLPVFRYAEILLIYAEAKAELGTLTQDDLDISVNLLRDRVGMPDMSMSAANSDPDYNYLMNPAYGYSNIKGENAGVIAEIRRERTIELAQEGNRRWDDLMRWREGKCIDQPLYGPYFPGLGAYDLDGDGVNDVCFYKDGTDPKPFKATANVKIGEDGYFSEGDHGYYDPFQGVPHSFNESRDYLYPIPSGERSKNHNLAQNPGWDDGLDF